MAPHILLQPGQIWSPQDDHAPQRQVVDFPNGMLSYTLMPRTARQNTASDDDGQNNDYVVSQSLFRRWIRETGAKLSGQAEAKAAPSIELSKKIVTLRKAYGMNQTELAKTLGISRSAIAALETGRRSCASKHLPKLAEIFQVPVELFLGGMVDQTLSMELSPDECDLIELYRHLSPERKLEVQKYTERRAQV